MHTTRTNAMMKLSHTLPCLLLLALPHALPAQQTRWTFQTDGPIFSSPTLHEGTVFVGSGDGHLYAVDAARGTERWRLRTGGAVDSSPAVADGTVFVLSRDGRMYAVDAARGTTKWTFETEGERKHDFWDFYLSDPLVHGDLVVFGSGDGSVYALDRASGALRWRHRTEGIVHAAPIAEGGLVYIGGFGGRLYALRADSGEPAWSFDTLGSTFFPRGGIQRAAAVADGVVYFGSRDYNLYALDAETGAVHWNLRDPAGWIIAPPLLLDGTVYIGSSDPYRFYAVHHRSGAARWTTRVPSRVFGGAAAVGDRIAFGGFDGRLYLVDRADGSVLWTYQTAASRERYASVHTESGDITEEMRTLYRDGRGLEAENRILSLGSIAGTPAVNGATVIFGSTDGSLYAVEVSP
jgi:eukaryotic-like serine/threonine-protein kinase